MRPLLLRYALARMDSLRTPDLGAELEAVVGKRIVSIERPTAKRLTLAITFEDAECSNCSRGHATGRVRTHEAAIVLQPRLAAEVSRGRVTRT